MMERKEEETVKTIEELLLRNGAKTQKMQVEEGMATRRVTETERDRQRERGETDREERDKLMTQRGRGDESKND